MGRIESAIQEVPSREIMPMDAYAWELIEPRADGVVAELIEAPREDATTAATDLVVAVKLFQLAGAQATKASQEGLPAEIKQRYWQAVTDFKQDFYAMADRIAWADRADRSEAERERDVHERMLLTLSDALDRAGIQLRELAESVGKLAQNQRLARYAASRQARLAPSK